MRVRKQIAVSAYSIIEMLVYIGVLAIIMSVGTVALFRCLNNSWAFRQSAGDVGKAFSAGERWRADMRLANGRPREETNSSQQVLHIPTRRGEITYLAATNAVLRRVGRGSWSCVLENVRASNMEADARRDVAAWRWEVELQPRARKPGKVRPLFTFIAVPRSGSNP